MVGCCGSCSTIRQPWVTTFASGPENVLAFDDEGTLYTADRTGSGTTIYTLDVRTGALTRVGSNAIPKLAGLAFQPPPLAPLYAADGAGGNAPSAA